MLLKQWIRTLRTRQGEHVIATGKHFEGRVYKGRGTGRTGSHTHRGKYVVEPWRLRSFIVPDLSNCQLKPFVTPKLEESRSNPVTFHDYFLEENIPPEMSNELVEKCREHAKRIQQFLDTPYHERIKIY